MESQKHGLLFEEDMFVTITGKTKDEVKKTHKIGYVDKFDIIPAYGSDHPYSMKMSKDGKNICFGDILRFYNSCKNEDFILLVGVYRQNGQIKILDSIYEFLFTGDQCSIIFGNIPEDSLINFVKYVKSIPPGKGAQLTHRKIWKQKRLELYENYEKPLISIDAKIDSKNQRRVQCSIKLSSLLETGILWTKYDKDYKGFILPHHYKSGPRQRSST